MTQVRFSPLNQGIPIVDGQGNPTPAFIQNWAANLSQISTSINGIFEALAKAEAAQATANVTNSYTAPTAVLSATDAGASATITVAGHTRFYGDGTSVTVTGSSLTGLPYSILYYVYYDDPTLAGGAVSYQVTTSPATGAQTGTRLTVGSITTPASGGGGTTGGGGTPPGSGGPIP